MKYKKSIRLICVIIGVSLFLIVFKEQRPETLQTFVSSTHQQIRTIRENIQEISGDRNILKTDPKYLDQLGFTTDPILFSKTKVENISLPVIVTYAIENQESQVIGLINNVVRFMPNNTIFVYNVNLDDYGLKTLANYCNSSKCQLVPFSFDDFPPHVKKVHVHAYRPIIIQDALQKNGAIFFIESSYRFNSHMNRTVINNWFSSYEKAGGVLTWSTPSKNPVSSLTHKKMFDYFETDADDFLFLQMINADVLFIVNTYDIHMSIMLKWVTCALIENCIVPIGAQSAGCRFDKKPQYRYSGCHSYDSSALNIVLGLHFKLDDHIYTYQGNIKDIFDVVPLEFAQKQFRDMELNATIDNSRYSLTNTV